MRFSWRKVFYEALCSLKKLLSQLIMCPARLGMQGRCRRADEVKIIQNWPTFEHKSVSSLSVLLIWSKFLSQLFKIAHMYKMLGPNFLFTRSREVWPCLFPIFARFGGCHKSHVTSVSYGSPIPYLGST